MTGISTSEIWAVKYPGGLFGKSGTPDILCCCKGQFVAIEVKADGKSMTQLQKLTSARIAAAGGIFHCVSSLQETKDIIGSLLQ